MNRTRSFRILIALSVAGGLALTGCAATAQAQPTASTTTTASADAPPEIALAGELTIFAAASLKSAFDELSTQFEDLHPDLDVLPITYDGSSTLATQILEGAPVDVFASADEKNMQKVVEGALADDPALFATNTLVLVVPRANPGEIAEIADLANADKTVVLCAPEVPCGAASATLLSESGIEASVDSFEQNVTAVLTKVAAGEADAGLVYVTDAESSADVEAIDVPGADVVINRYPIVALTDAENPDAAAAFEEFVLSADGQKVLEGLGFGAP